MSLYPEITPFKTEYLRVSPVHELHIRQFGRADGAPAVHLHGAHSVCSIPLLRLKFDPKHYRIITFDQRGAGLSTPSSSLEDNTTQDLMDDIEKIREHLQIKRWLVFGGSWGSTLSLAYAQAHADRVTALVLRGIFLLRKTELRFFYEKNGSSMLFPEAHERFRSVIPGSEQDDLISAFHKRLTGPEGEDRQRAAKAWTAWEMCTSRLHVDPEALAKAEKDDFADSFSRIEVHYFKNGGFIREGQLLEPREIDKIRHIPTVIVQGRYDCVCPAQSAWDLHKAFPESEIIIVPDAGHSAKEPGIERELVKATDRFRRLDSGVRGT